jgi:hypothetical protein
MIVHVWASTRCCHAGEKQATFHSVQEKALVVRPDCSGRNVGIFLLQADQPTYKRYRHRVKSLHLHVCCSGLLVRCCHHADDLLLRGEVHGQMLRCGALRPRAGGDA